MDFIQHKNPSNLGGQNTSNAREEENHAESYDKC